jgi:hypothetical protein
MDSRRLALTLLSLLAFSARAWGAANPVSNASCPYFYSAPEKSVPGWIQAIAKHRMNVVVLDQAQRFNWIVPLRWDGKISPDNVDILAQHDVSQKLKAEEALARCVCDGRTKVEAASKAIVLWRHHISGESPFNGPGGCPP